jgi:hypothetical protein
MSKPSKSARTSQGLRDILFDEIDQLRGENGDPQRATAVANLAKQIVNTAKVEMDFVRTTQAIEAAGGNVMLGQLKLGS